MSRIRHASLEQTPTPPPERLPRLVPPPATISPPRRHQNSDHSDTVPPNFPPRYPARRISEDNSLGYRYPSGQITPPSQKHRRFSSVPHAYDCNNTYTGASADARRLRNNLPSVTSGVAVNSFQDESQPSSEDPEKRKRFNLKEFRQKRREKRDSRNFSLSDSDNNAVSWILLLTWTLIKSQSCFIVASIGFLNFTKRKYLRNSHTSCDLLRDNCIKIVIID